MAGREVWLHRLDAREAIEVILLAPSCTSGWIPVANSNRLLSCMNNNNKLDKFNSRDDVEINNLTYLNPYIINGLGNPEPTFEMSLPKPVQSRMSNRK